jgi:peptidoglycan L-alanyl-D-glutamate endopeptidase CwlK
MSSRSLDDLDPRFRPFVDSFIAACATQALDVLIYCTYRSTEEQDELFTHGRTAPGKIVTNAHGGQSAHNYRMAFDGCPLLHGKPLWEEPLSHEHWQLYGKIAVDCGMEWGGHWPGHLVEGPHCQMALWKDIAGL